MKKILGIFTQRWFISFLGVAALAALVWFVGPLVSIAGSEPLASDISRLVVIMVLVLLWGIFNLIAEMRAKKANTQIIEGLVEPEAAPEPAAGGFAPDQSLEEINILRQRFEEAMAVLKKSGKKGGGNSLYELPWYVIIGPPGSGKTTALVHSGLEFPLADKFGKEALRGVGGTRNCDWWFTDEAILLDTAGRYVTQDSHAVADSTGWEAFLGLLKKHRRRRPINGVLVAMSIADLMVQNEHQRSMHVSAIKNRIQELKTHLGMSFPVYLLFTKCDLVAGFMDFFEDLGREERAQVWGVTFKLEEEGGAPPVEQLGEQYDLLLSRLNARLATRLIEERDVQRRHGIYGFPQQIASLKPTIEAFVRDIFRATRFEDQPLLRGVYFTSGTQEGTPIDRVMGSVARTFGLGGQAMPSMGGRGRSYFITNLLRYVVFEESAIAGTDRKYERRRAWMQRLAYAGALGATAIAAIAWSTSFTRNQGYVDRVEDQVAEYEAMASEPVRASGDGFLKVLPRLDKLRSLTEVYGEFEEGVPLLMGLGLYQGDKLTEGALRAYTREMNRVLRPLVAARVQEQLQGSFGDPDLQFEALKVYLMLGDPQRLDPDLLSLWMRIEWRNSYPADPDARDRLQAHLAVLLEGGWEPVQLDAQLVADARLALNQVPLAELVYSRLRRDLVAEDTAPFRMSDVIGPRGRKAFERASGEPLETGIPGLFTYRGFHELYRKQSETLVERIREESWVLGKGEDTYSQTELEQLDEELLELYLNDYTRVWKDMLKDLRVVSFNSIAEGVEVLEILSAGPASPMTKILQAVDRNTSLTQLAAGTTAPGGVAAKAEALASGNRLSRLLGRGDSGGAGAAGAIPGAQVEEAFEQVNRVVRPDNGHPAPIVALMDVLSRVYGHLDALSDDDEGEPRVLRRLRKEAVRQPEPVKSWLRQVAQNSRDVTEAKVERDTRTALAKRRTDIREVINAAWVSDVLPTCQNAVEGRYPLVRTSAAQVPLKDFGRFFGPDGLMDGFMKKHLRPFVDASGTQWKWRESDGVKLGASPEVLAQFQRAARIRDAFFQDGTPSPSVRFGLKPLYLDANVTLFLLDIGGDKFTYRHGPARVHNARWPGSKGDEQARAIFEDASGGRATISAEGPWAWFRVLDSVQVEAVAADRLVATFVAEGRTARYEIRASSVVNPFLEPALREFSCPGGF